jgi:hypothetical protein
VSQVRQTSAYFMPIAQGRGRLTREQFNRRAVRMQPNQLQDVFRMSGTLPGARHPFRRMVRRSWIG